MKQLLTILLSVFFILKANSQTCPPGIEDLQPTIVDKDVDEKFYGLKDAAGKSMGDALYQAFQKALESTTGLHGQFYLASVSDNQLIGLNSYTASAKMFNIYCKKATGLNWKGLYNLRFYCMANDLGYFGGHVNNDDIRMSDDHQIYVDHQIVYRLLPRKAASLVNGYPSVSFPNDISQIREVLITKPGSPLFLPVTRRDYLLLMRENAKVQIAVLQKNIAEYKRDRQPVDTRTWEEHLKCCMTVEEKGWMKSWTDFLSNHPEAHIKFDKEMAGRKLDWEKDKTSLEDGLSIYIKNWEKDIKEIGEMLSSNNANFLNAPCITTHLLESLGGKSLKDEHDYFTDDTGLGYAWVVINPAYLNKKLPLSVPQFFTVGWTNPKSDAEKRAVSAFKQIFDFKSLERLISK